MMWRRTGHDTMQEAKLLDMLHCLEEKQRLRKLLNKEKLGDHEQSDFAPFLF